MGVMEDSEPASMAVGISYAMRAEYDVVCMRLPSNSGSSDGPSVILLTVDDG